MIQIAFAKAKVNMLYMSIVFAYVCDNGRPVNWVSGKFALASKNMFGSRGSDEVETCWICKVLG